MRGGCSRRPCCVCVWCFQTCCCALCVDALHLHGARGRVTIRARRGAIRTVPDTGQLDSSRFWRSLPRRQHAAGRAFGRERPSTVLDRDGRCCAPRWFVDHWAVRHLGSGVNAWWRAAPQRRAIADNIEAAYESATWLLDLTPWPTLSTYVYADTNCTAANIFAAARAASGAMTFLLSRGGRVLRSVGALAVSDRGSHARRGRSSLRDARLRAARVGTRAPALSLLVRSDAAGPAHSP